MRADRVVVTTPALDDDLGLFQCVEDLTIEKLITQTGIEALDISVLPWTAWRDVGCLGAGCGDPILHGFGDELGAIVRSNGCRYAAQDEEIG